MMVTHWYKQSVYDPSDSKIGEIMDVLMDRDGKVVALIVGVGGFLGMGEKDIAVPFKAVQFRTKDSNKWYPVMNTTKDALKNARGTNTIAALRHGFRRIPLQPPAALQLLHRDRTPDKEEYSFP
jgi:hypothetical protein